MSTDNIPPLGDLSAEQILAHSNSVQPKHVSNIQESLNNIAINSAKLGPEETGKRLKNIAKNSSQNKGKKGKDSMATNSQQPAPNTGAGNGVSAPASGQAQAQPPSQNQTAPAAGSSTPTQAQTSPVAGSSPTTQSQTPPTQAQEQTSSANEPSLISKYLFPVTALLVIVGLIVYGLSSLGFTSFFDWVMSMLSFSYDDPNTVLKIFYLSFAGFSLTLFCYGYNQAETKYFSWTSRVTDNLVYMTIIMIVFLVFLIGSLVKIHKMIDLSSPSFNRPSISTSSGLETDSFTIGDLSKVVIDGKTTWQLCVYYVSGSSPDTTKLMISTEHNPQMKGEASVTHIKKSNGKFIVKIQFKDNPFPTQGTIIQNWQSIGGSAPE